MKKIILALGSNLGDRKKNLENAIELLTQNLFLQNIRVSQILANKALLKPDSPVEWDIEFFNLAISANIDLAKFPPQRILEIIKKIEKEIGRSNAHIHWAPREIDIDILAIENIFIDEENLKIPHAHLFERDFFLQIFSEIEPSYLSELRRKLK